MTTARTLLITVISKPASSGEKSASLRRMGGSRFLASLEMTVDFVDMFGYYEVRVRNALGQSN